MTLEVLLDRFVCEGQKPEGSGYRPPIYGWAPYQGPPPYSAEYFLSGSISGCMLESLQSATKFYRGSGYSYSTELNKAISQKLMQECSLGATHRTRCVYLSAPPNSPTTYDFQRQKVVGMHLDNFRATTDGVPEANMRFLLNIGTSARYFLISSLTSSRIAGRLQSGTKLAPSQAVAKAIIEERVQIYRFRMEPGFYYIARTDHFAHDGMSPQAHRDHVLTFRTSIYESR